MKKNPQNKKPQGSTGRWVLGLYLRVAGLLEQLRNFLGIQLGNLVAHDFLLGRKGLSHHKGLVQDKEPGNLLKEAESILGADGSLNLLVNELLYLLGFQQTAVVLVGNLLLLGVSHNLLLRGHDDGSQEALVLSHHHGLGDVAGIVQLHLDGKGFNVLTTPQHDGVLDASLQHQLAPQGNEADVAGVKPAVLVNRLGRQILPLVVAFHDGGTLHLHRSLLALGKDCTLLVNNPNLYILQRSADGSKNRLAEGPHGNHRGSLGKAVALHQIHTDGPEEFVNLRGQGASTGNAAPEACSQLGTNLLEHNHSAQGLQRIQQHPGEEQANPGQHQVVVLEPGGLAEQVAVNLRVDFCHAHKKLEQGIHHTAGFPHGAVDSLVHGLEDSRDGGQDLRVDFQEVRQKHAADGL